MPLYDYKCQSHGVFHELATLDESATPCACPVCGELSARVIMLSPSLIGMDAERRQAMERNERARHEPVFSNNEYRQEQAERRAFHKRHHKGCGCGAEDAPIGKSRLFFTADGKKMFPSMRPWMISH